MILNGRKENCYLVTEKFFSIGDKLFLSHIQGGQVYRIEERLLQFLPEYRIYENGEEVAKVKKRFSLFKPRFEINSKYGSLTFAGDTNDYKLFRDGKIVAETFLSTNNIYGVSIADNVHINHGLLLAVVIGVDQILNNLEEVT